jgi:hypothetical protein
MIPLIPFGSDEQLSWAVVNCAHRIRSIPEQVQNHLLERNAITCNSREIIGKFRPQNYPVPLKFT